jgi:predicted protein tyrosine phosphatase
VRRVELKNVIFTGRDQAEASAAWPHWAVISISGLNPAVLKEGWHSVLRLEFDDIDVVGDFDLSEPYILFSEAQAEQVIEFVQTVRDSHEVEGILVHCQAGISRSAAVAKWIAEKYVLPYPERYMLYNKHVYRTLSEAMNRRLLASEVLE